MLQMHSRACIVCDEEATGELRVKTVKYFKGIQETMTNLLKRPMIGYSGRHSPRTSPSLGATAAAAADVPPAPLDGGAAAGSGAGSGAGSEPATKKVRTGK